MGKYIGIFLGVTVFILCGFAHCVANMFYFSAANVWGGWALLYMLVMTLGNACGGVIIPLAVGCGQHNKTKLSLCDFAEGHFCSLDVVQGIQHQPGL